MFQITADERQIIQRKSTSEQARIQEQLQNTAELKRHFGNIVKKFFSIFS